MFSFGYPTCSKILQLQNTENIMVMCCNIHNQIDLLKEREVNENKTWQFCSKNVILV